MAVKPDAPTSRAELLARVRALEEERRVREEELAAYEAEIRVVQEQLIESRNQLEASRDRYADLYDFAPVGYVTLDANGIIEEINLIGARMLGLERSRVVGSPFLLYVAEPDRAAFLDHMTRCRHAQNGARTVTELTTKPRSGPPIPIAVETRGSIAADARAFRTVIIDLTDRRRAEDERLRNERERQRVIREEETMRAAGEAKDRFLAMLSHELRAPLTSLVFTLGAIRQRDDLPPQLGRALRIIDRNIDLEIRLIDDLLDVTRIQRGKLRLERAPVDAHAFLHEFAESFTGEAAARGIELAVAADATEPHLHADPVRLRQVLRNLVTNALNHTPRGGRITLGSGTPAAELLVLFVRDTGAGIRPEQLDRIFDPFQQARDGQGTRGGLGLGLAIAKGIVEAHDGAIVAESGGTGLGATFRVTLHTTFGAGEASPRPRTAVRPKAGRRILLVEDNVDNASAISEFLRIRGYEVSVATSMAGGVRAASEGFDVLVSDIGLPDGSGLDLMRALARDNEVRAVALSGYGTREDVERSRDAGFRDHLTKPIDPEELVEAIERVAAPTPPARRSRNRLSRPFRALR